ncbi:hypothetical protein ACJJIQ_17660 [Microbulbifer sp. ANSA003]|uniref:hypothetical protein n=1 Tax=Microbulbifer sp. ANSA003 TaxID=3243360 RepID=UPI004042F74B
MESLINSFEQIKLEFEKVFELMDEIPDEEYDQKYIAVRGELLEFLKSAKESCADESFVNLESQVIEFLCENMGCHLDMEVLEKYSPEVLSSEQVKYIQSNSALGRWL